MSLCAMILLGIPVILKLRHHHHKGVGENIGKDFDARLDKFIMALDKATQFVHHALNHTL